MQSKLNMTTTKGGGFKDYNKTITAMTVRHASVNTMANQVKLHL